MTSSTLSQILSQSRQRLTPLHESAQLDAEVLVAHVLNFSRAQLYTWPEKVLSKAQQVSIEAFIDRRCDGEPVAYITAHKEFWSLDFKVTKDTLIPRPETELLVELALAHIPRDATWRIADLGTGSGIIAIAIAKERPACQLLAVDKSEQALKIAIENAENLDVSNVTFQQSDWFDSLENEAFDLIISNPPYIAARDKHLSSGDLIYEPKTALVSGDDGLDDLVQMITQAKKHLMPGAALLLEHGWEQVANVRKLFKDKSYDNIRSHKDLLGIERVTLGFFQ